MNCWDGDPDCNGPFSDYHCLLCAFAGTYFLNHGPDDFAFKLRLDIGDIGGEA